MASNLDEVREAAEEAGALLQEIQDFLGRTAQPVGAVRFPRGYLPSAEEGRRSLEFVSSYNLRTNLSYALMLKGVYTWVLQRTDLAATAREMVIKAALFLQGSIAEALLNDALRGVMGKRQRFSSRTARLEEDGVISEALRADLDWLWEERNRQHLFEIEDREIDRYADADFNRAERTLAQLIDQLRAHADHYEQLREAAE